MKKIDISIEPMTRLEGHMGAFATADCDSKKYVDAYAYATMFRGLEDILIGHEPADAIWLAQRSCGVCPTPHATAAVIACDMAYNAPPPPLAIALRNMAFMAEEVYDGALGCGILEGPDYSEDIVKKVNPELWEKAQNAAAPHCKEHGYATIADMMVALNPVSGSFWLRCLGAAKTGISMATILCAKHPHQNTFIPGGIARTVELKSIEQYYAMLASEVAFTKELVPFIDDLVDFCQANGLENVGEFPFDLYSWGCYDDPYAYNAKYADMGKWGLKRMVPPGIVIDGKLITNDLIEMNVGVQETVTHSYYNDTPSAEFPKDPCNNPLTKDHPWNESTKPFAAKAMDFENKYSWAKTPRWYDWKNRVDGKTHVLAGNPLSRLYIAAVSQDRPESTGKSVKFTLPRGTVAGSKVSDEVTMEWKVPAKNNSLERVRARAYYHAYSAYCAYKQTLQALEMIKKGETKVWNQYKRPESGFGVGLVEGMRGGVGHWVVMQKGKIHRYQIITPTAWDISPRDAEGRPGPYEAAIIGSDCTEPVVDGKITGIDVVRTIHSFDPCLGCTVQIFDPQDKLIVSQELSHVHVDDVFEKKFGNKA